MVEKLQGDNMTIKVLIFVIGLLIGLGSAHVITLTKVEGNSIKIEAMQRTVDRNQETIITTLDLVKAVVQQNSALINSVVAGNNP
jgi:hypothetical protein